MDRTATANAGNGNANANRKRVITCLDCHYRVSSRDANGLVWNICSHPEHGGRSLPYLACGDFVEREGA